MKYKNHYDKNILVIGPSRSGKSTLSRKFNEEFGFSVINLDDIVSGFEEAFPELKIQHESNDSEVATRLAPFLIRYLKELSDGPNFYNGNKYVIEGVVIDFERYFPK